eukprot:293985-Hanusia_phi.AAC.7
MFYPRAANRFAIGEPHPRVRPLPAINIPARAGSQLSSLGRQTKYGTAGVRPAAGPGHSVRSPGSGGRSGRPQFKPKPY